MPEGEAARQIVPSFMRRVRAARADSVTTASRRGLDVRLSPTHTDPKWPEASARSAVSSRRLGGMPNSTARFGRLIPNSTASSPRSVMADPSFRRYPPSRHSPPSGALDARQENSRSNSTATRYNKMPRSDTTSRAANMRSVRSVCVEYMMR